GMCRSIIVILPFTQRWAVAMNTYYKRLCVVLASLALDLAACSDQSVSSDPPTVSQVSKQLDAELRSGDSEERIKQVLGRIGVQYSYNKIVNSLEGTMPRSRRVVNGVKGVVFVRVYLNQDHTYSRLAVNEMLTDV